MPELSWTKLNARWNQICAFESWASSNYKIVAANEQSLIYSVRIITCRLFTDMIHILFQVCSGQCVPARLLVDSLFHSFSFICTLYSTVFKLDLFTQSFSFVALFKRSALFVQIFISLIRFIIWFKTFFSLLGGFFPSFFDTVEPRCVGFALRSSISWNLGEFLKVSPLWRL